MKKKYLLYFFRGFILREDKNIYISDQTQFKREFNYFLYCFESCEIYPGQWITGTIVKEAKEFFSKKEYPNYSAFRDFALGYLESRTDRLKMSMENKDKLIDKMYQCLHREKFNWDPESDFHVFYNNMNKFLTEVYEEETAT